MLREHFIPRHGLDQIGGRAVGKTDIGRQVAVQSMGDLVAVVADATKLGEQVRVHGPVPGRSLDFALADQPLAQTRDAEPRVLGINRPAQILIRCQPDGDGLAPWSGCMRSWLGHRHTRQGLGSGRVSDLTGGVWGVAEHAPRREGSCNRLPRQRANDCKSTSRYPASKATCVIQFTCIVSSVIPNFILFIAAFTAIPRIAEHGHAIRHIREYADT